MGTEKQSQYCTDRSIQMYVRWFEKDEYFKIPLYQNWDFECLYMLSHSKKLEVVERFYMYIIEGKFYSRVLKGF